MPVATAALRKRKATTAHLDTGGGFESFVWTAMSGTTSLLLL
jgi:hypothetical protein